VARIGQWRRSMPHRFAQLAEITLKLGARGTTTLALHIRNMCSHERPQWQSHRVGSLPHTSMSDTWAVMRSVVRYLSALGSNE
jgi:hypothetical protein